MTTAAYDIREAIIERLSDLPGYKKLPRRVPLPQQQPTDLPQLSVFIMGERLIRSGDGEPAFDVEVTIGISDMRGFATTLVLDGQNDAAVDAIEERLLCDPTFTRKGDPSRDEGDPFRYPLFEHIAGITRRRIYPQDGETFFAELRLEMVFRTWVSFPPSVPDDFKSLAFSLGQPGQPISTDPIFTIEVPEEETP